MLEMLFSLFHVPCHPPLRKSHMKTNTPRCWVDKHHTRTPPCPAHCLRGCRSCLGCFFFCLQNSLWYKGNKACYPVELIQSSRAKAGASSRRKRHNQNQNEWGLGALQGRDKVRSKWTEPRHNRLPGSVGAAM